MAYTASLHIEVTEATTDEEALFMALEMASRSMVNMIWVITNIENETVKQMTPAQETSTFRKSRPSLTLITTEETDQ